MCQSSSRTVRSLLLAVLTAVLLACSSTAPGGSSAGPSNASVRVLAASSLRAALPEVARAFEKAHPGTAVELTFDGSARLATAIKEGAPADVFASADHASMQAVATAGNPVTPVIFATNRLAIAVAPGNPHDVAGLADLLTPTLVVSLCADDVPCGRYAREAFTQAGLTLPAAGGEASVTGVLSRVRLGEADVGIVYVTDLVGADGIEGFPLPDGEQVVATYPAVALAGASDPAAARAFVAFLAGPDGEAILSRFGFGAP